MIKNSFTIRKYTFILFLAAEQLNITHFLVCELYNLRKFFIRRYFFFRLIDNHYAPQKFKFLIYNIIIYYVKVSCLTKNFLLLLLRNNIFSIVNRVFFFYRVFFLQKLNFSIINVLLPTILCDSISKKFKKFFFKFMSNENLIFNFCYDKDILNGLILSIGTEILDLSFVFKLNLLLEIIKNKI